MSHTMPAPGQSYPKLSRLFGGLAFLFGATVLVGWQFDLVALRSVMPGLISMQPPTAAAFLLIGAAICGPKARAFGFIACGLVLAASGLSLIEYVTGSGNLIDSLLYPQAVLHQAAMPRYAGRMAEGTAVAFALLSLSVGLHRAAGERVPSAAHIALSALPLAIGGISLLGYVLEVPRVRGLLGYTDIALPTAAGLVTLGVAALMLRPDAACLRLLASPGASGRLTRRMLPAILLLTPILAWLTLKASQTGVITIEFRLVLMTLGTVLGLTLLALDTGRRMALTEERLEQQRERLRVGEARLQELVTTAHEAIVTADQGGTITGWNRQAETTFGWTASEVLGLQMRDLIIPARLRAAHDSGMSRFLATGAKTVIGQRVEVPALRNDGSEFLIEMALSATQGEEGWRFTAMMHDISERKAQSELFETTFDYAPIGVALVGLDGRFLKVNRSFAGLVGYPVEEMLATDFQTITHPDDLGRDLELLGRLTAGEIPEYQMDKRYLRKDGGVIWVNLAVSMVRHLNGSPKHCIAQVQDLTARMEAEARYRLMAENATDMIVTSDMRGRTTFVSAGCTAITGWEPAEALGRDTAEFVHPEDVEKLKAAFRRTAAGEPSQRVRWRGWHRKREEWLWLESSPSILTQSDSPSFVDVVREVTAQVAQEEALVAARNEAEAAASAKSEFLANMSHEIRTPLTAVIGFSGMLCARPDLTPEARIFGERISIASKALLSVVNGILDFSKLEAGEVEVKPRPRDVSALARDMLGLLKPQADAKGIDLCVESDEGFPSLLMCDEQLLGQVLLNLLSNAVKFTDTGRVTLRIAHRGERLMVAVSDTGAGLSLEQQAKLFQRFSQVDGSSTRRHGGTGLGLAICKGLVQAMGGAIGVTSQPGSGSTFHFEVAAPVAAMSTAWAEAAPGVSIEGVRILVADNNGANRELVRTMLEGLGAEVHEAADGLEAVEAAQSWPFDCILLDIRMPRLDGRGALLRIRSERGPNRDVPILALGADQPGETLPGFHSAMSKPMTAAALLRGIGEAIADLNSTAGDADVRVA
jgi:PAS domain S-box-containing protein